MVSVVDVAAHQAGIRALLTDGPGAFDVWFDPPQSPESLPTQAFPYVVVHLPPGLVTTDVAVNLPHRVDLDFRTVCVALLEDQLDWVRDRVVSRLALRRPVVEGRDCTHIRHIGSMPMTADADVPDRRVLNGPDSWEFVSRAVAAA